MNRSTEISDPFARHRKVEVQPESVQAQPAVEAIEINPTEAPAVEPCPATKPVARAGNPFAQHTNKTERRPRPAPAQVPPAERLMAWLPRWHKATISVRDARLYGPNSLRDPKLAADAIAVLAGFGWLVPVMTRQHNMEWWQIVRGRDQAVASPGVAEP
jgi:hypothetical protein